MHDAVVIVRTAQRVYSRLVLAELAAPVQNNVLLKHPHVLIPIRSCLLMEESDGMSQLVEKGAMVCAAWL